jgi:transient receptor potential cation channel subfamily C member 4
MGDVEAGVNEDGRKLSHVKEFDFEDTPEAILSPVEKMFLLTAEKGDVPGVKRIIDENRDNRREFNMNCVDPLNRTALLSAIENENFELIELLLKEGIEVKDALLHAIFEEYVEGVEYLLEWEETTHKPGEPYVRSKSHVFYLRSDH